ncbi:hypothetical protein UlMin_036111, partial [Ulmus minor]
LWTREEKEIAIVTHSAFLSESLKAFYHDSHSPVKTEVCKWFTNCELRSLVIVDKRSGYIPPPLNLYFFLFIPKIEKNRTSTT